MVKRKVFEGEIAPEEFKLFKQILLMMYSPKYQKEEREQIMKATEFRVVKGVVKRNTGVSKTKVKFNVIEK